MIECSLLNFSDYLLTLCTVRLLILLVSRISTIKLTDGTRLPQLSFLVSLSIPALPMGHIYVQYTSTTGHETFDLCYNFRSWSNSLYLWCLWCVSRVLLLFRWFLHNCIVRHTTSTCSRWTFITETSPYATHYCLSGSFRGHQMRLCK